jgi:hypothetical protein
MPCGECGASVAWAERDVHVCDPERLLDYGMFQLRDEIEAIEGEVEEYMDSPRGRFERWLASEGRI